MNCPVCDDKMREVEKYGVTMDICPGCKGVWLDRGELDKIINLVQQEETSAPGPAPASPQPAAPAPDPRYAEPVPEYHRRSHDHDDDDDDHHRERQRFEAPGDQRQGRPRRRGGLLGELFDMIGD